MSDDNMVSMFDFELPSIQPVVRKPFARCAAMPGTRARGLCASVEPGWGQKKKNKTHMLALSAEKDASEGARSSPSRGDNTCHITCNDASSLGHAGR